MQLLKNNTSKETTKMKQKNLQTTLFLLAALTAASCSNENDPSLNPDNPSSDVVELGIASAGVALTKGVIQGGDNGQSGEGANILQEVAIRATGDDYKTSNNTAIYKQSSGNWSNSASTNDGKIWLTSKPATIYAFHPAYTYDANGNKTSTVVTVSGTVGTNATISVGLFEGGEATSGTPTLKENSTITDADNYSSGTILSAPGEVDYLWEGSTTRPTASNGKAAGTPPNKSVDLNMKHALSLVSFKVVKADSYKGPALLTKIVLKNKGDGTVLNKGTGATMDIKEGTITVSGSSAATFVRLIKASGSENGAALQVLASAHTYSILVFPDASGVAKNTIEAVFTIDGADYTVDMAANATPVQWAAGKNNTYTATLSGTGLEISSVKVAAWGSGNGGSLDVH